MTVEPELRLALGMRGGVSLAVWMGGACSEIDLLRHSLDVGSPGRPAPVVDPIYSRLLQTSGYGSVVVDVIAGASAGGLNGVLMGCSIVHGVRFDHHIRNLWLRLGDLGRLVRAPGVRRPRSPLDGDKGFYGQLAPELRKLVHNVPSHQAPEKPPRVDAIFTCTLFDAAPRTRFQELGPPIVEDRNRAWFRFQHRDVKAADRHPLAHRTGFGVGTDRDAALDRLAYAARATSSFPGAFEPASIGYAENSVARGGHPPPPPTHYGSFSESRKARPKDLAESGARDYVMDGGVLDNIPVAWAVRSIAAAPADCAVDRWLVYLQPLPFASPEPPVRGVPDLLQTVERARGLQGGTEKLADDLDDIERLNAETLRREGFRQVLEYALGQVPEGEDLADFMTALFDRAWRSTGAYRERAGAMEAARIRALWIDPMPVLGADPLSFVGVTRDPLEARHAPLLRRLGGVGPDLVLAEPEEETTASAGDAGRVAALLGELRSPQSLGRTVSLLLDTSRNLGADALAIKFRLYGIRSAIERVIAEADRALAAAPRELGDVDMESVDIVELVRASTWGGTPAPGPGWFDWSSLWTGLVAEAQALAAVVEAAATADEAQADEDDDEDDDRAFLSCLVWAAQDQPNQAQKTAAVLASVELLTGPLRPDPLAETTRVRFHMITAQNQSELVLSLRPKRSGFRERLRDLVRGVGMSVAPDDEISVDDKLAGSQLRNFGAFLSSRWRLNDWIWGRLDAARSLVEVATARMDDPATVERDASEPAAVLADRQQAMRDAFGLTDAEYDTPAKIRAEIVRRLHERILRSELPVLDALKDDGPPKGDLNPSPLTGDIDDLRPGVAKLLAIGKQTPLGLAPDNLARLPDLGRLVGVGGYAAGGSYVLGLGRRLGRRLTKFLTD